MRRETGTQYGIITCAVFLVLSVFLGIQTGRLIRGKGWGTIETIVTIAVAMFVAANVAIRIFFGSKPIVIRREQDGKS